MPHSGNPPILRGDMLIDFTLGEGTAQFSRNPDTGRAQLVLPDRTIQLQSPWNPLTHLSLGTVRTWERDVDGHAVLVSITRPRMAGGLRRSMYTIEVDGSVVAEVEGK